jgi:hypothetical protein
MLAKGRSFSIIKHWVHDIIVSSPPPLSSDTMSTSPAKVAVGFNVLANMKTATPWHLEGINGLYVFSLSCVYYDANSSGYKNKTNWRWWRLPIYEYRQQRLNGGADRSAAKDGQVLPHFQQIVTGALMPPCPIAVVF